MNYNKRNIVLVELIFSEKFRIKKRPALIISDEWYHNKRKEIIIAAIANNIKHILPEML